MRLTIKHWTSRLVLAVAVAATFASCSKDDVASERLPDGKYPLTFTASVEGLTATKAATRGTVDNSWAGNEEVAVQVGSDVKKYTVASGGALTSSDGFYWQNTAEQKTVSAWVPYSAARPTSFTVAADQNANNGAGFQQSDFLYAAPATIAYSGSKELTFKHLPAKVVVNLKADTQKGITEDEVKNATVTLVKQALTSGAIAEDGTVAQATTGSGVITANVVTSPIPVGYQKTVQALTTPRQMAGKQFICVTIGTGSYYYTPTGNDANLEAGKQYTYNITVSRTGLSGTVTVSDWDNSPGTVNPDAGMGDDPFANAQVGDFYCKDEFGDGAYLISKDAKLTTEQKAACLGIVLKVGKDANDPWKDDCVYKQKDGTTPMNTIHGYVLALYDANGGSTCEWGLYGTQVSHNDMNRDKDKGFYGYKNTQAIKSFATSNNKTLQSDFPAAYWASVDYETRESGKYAAPINSSGWFLPSAGQCQYWLNNRELLLTQVQKATGVVDYNWQYWYWSSSEDGGNPSYNAWYVNFSHGGMGWYYKNGGLCVRSCLAF